MPKTPTTASRLVAIQSVAGGTIAAAVSAIESAATSRSPRVKAAGAEHFCWINPSEQFAAPSGERWVPSCERGAFLYLRAAGLTPVYFPLA